jgi:hypothetical protein
LAGMPLRPAGGPTIISSIGRKGELSAAKPGWDAAENGAQARDAR